MENVTITLKAVFVVTTLLTVGQFYLASNKSKGFLFLVIVWMIIHMGLGLSGFYTDGYSMPPRFLLMLLPPSLLAIGMFLTPKGRRYIDSLDAKQLTLIHTIRIALEIMLYYLFIAKTVPEIMTFEGRNFDIISGLTAQIIYYFGYVLKKLSKQTLIVWNILTLALGLNIVITAILSASTPLQQFGFDQPNIAVTFFPFTWLPSVVVPIILFSHFATLRQLMLVKKEVKSNEAITKVGILGL